MAFPNLGQGRAASSTADLGVKRAPSRIGQTPKKALNAKVPQRPNLLGGGGMAVGPMRNAAGMPQAPMGPQKTTLRQMLLRGMKG